MNGGPVGSHLRDICLVALAGIAVFLLGTAIAGDGLVATQLAAWTTSLAMIAAVIVLQRRRGESLRHLGLERFPSNIRSFAKLLMRGLVALVAALAAFVIGSIVMANITGVPEQADMSGYDFLSRNPAMFLVVLPGVFVASSFGEELVYRGFLTTRFAAIFGSTRSAWIWAGVVSSVLFGLAHYSWGWMGIVQTAFMGGALVVTWRKFGGNLWVVILAHAILDLTLMLQVYFGP